MNFGLVSLAFDHLVLGDSLKQSVALLDEGVHTLVFTLHFLLNDDIVEAVSLLLPLFLKNLSTIDSLHARDLRLVLVKTGGKDSLGKLPFQDYKLLFENLIGKGFGRVVL